MKKDSTDKQLTSVEDPSDLDAQSRPDTGDGQSEIRPDIDRLVVLVKEASSVKAITTFLGRRGLDLFVSSSLQDVIEKLSGGWSKFLLLSLNYPHPKVDVFPTLLGQSFQAETIVFAESLDRKISPRLTACRAKHVLHGTASGPVVLMRLRQLQKELAEGSHGDPNASATERSMQSDGDQGSDVRISGSSSGQKGAILLKGGKPGESGADGLDPMARLMKALGEAGQHATPSGDTSGTAARSNDKPSVHFESTGNNRLMQLNPKGLSSHERAQLKANLQKGRLQSLGAQSSKETTQNQTHNRSDSNRSLDRAGKDQDSQVSQESAAAKSHSADVSPIATSSPKVHTGLPAIDPSALQRMTPVQRLQLCASRTLEKLFGKPTAGKDAMLQYRTASVLILRSDIISGSIAAAVGKGEFDDRAILQRVEAELLEQLTEIGIEVAIGALEAFEVQPASSIEDAFLSSEFTVIARAETFEIGFGYVDTLPQEPQVVGTIDDMIQVDIQSIQADVPLPFDVFIHLPANQKYLRYIKTDSVLSGKQKQKLTQSDVDKLFLGKDAQDAYRKHATVTSFKKKIAKSS